jgi:hypothetical protein
MKSLCWFVAVAVCLGLPSAAFANAIPFSAGVLDPSPPGGTFLDSNTFSAPFSACSAFSNPSAPSAVQSDYCFEGINATGSPDDPVPTELWTSLTVTIDDPTDILGPINANCGNLDPTDSTIFGSATCSQSNGVDTLSFTGGSGIGSGNSFFLVIDAPSVTVTQLDSLSATAVAGVAPEPDSLVLLASGMMMIGIMLYADRRRMLRNSMRS